MVVCMKNIKVVVVMMVLSCITPINKSFIKNINEVCQENIVRTENGFRLISYNNSNGDLQFPDVQDKILNFYSTNMPEESIEISSFKIKYKIKIKMKPQVKDKSIAYRLFLSKQDYSVFKIKAPIFLYTKTYLI